MFSRFMSPLATQHYVADNMLPTNYRMGGTGVTCHVMAITIPLGANTRIVPKNKAKTLFIQFQLLTI